MLLLCSLLFHLSNKILLIYKLEEFSLCFQSYIFNYIVSTLIVSKVCIYIYSVDDISLFDTIRIKIFLLKPIKALKSKIQWNYKYLSDFSPVIFMEEKMYVTKEKKQRATNNAKHESC